MEICFSLILLALLSALCTAGVAQGFTPLRPVEIIVHAGPGGGNDVVARYMSALIEKEKLRNKIPGMDRKRSCRRC